jgi:hypothetical protein
MTEDNSTKIIKLSSGEEIICKLVEPEKPTRFLISNPLQLSSSPKVTKNGIEEAISLKRWIHFAEETVYDVPKSQVILVATASIGLVKFYEHCVHRMNQEDANIYSPPSKRDLDGIEDEDLFDDMDDYIISSKLMH